MQSAATTHTMDAWHDQASAWLSLQVISHSVLTSPAWQSQGKVQAQCQFWCLSYVLFCKVINARLLSLQLGICMCKVNCFPAARIRNVVEKVSALMKLPIGIRIVAKDLTDSEQEMVLDLMAGGKALLRLTNDRDPANGSVRMWQIQK